MVHLIILIHLIHLIMLLVLRLVIMVQINVVVVVTHLIIAVNQLIALAQVRLLIGAHCTLLLHICIVVPIIVVAVHICIANFDLLLQFQFFLRKNDGFYEPNIVELNILLDCVENVTIHIAIDELQVHVVGLQQLGRVELGHLRFGRLLDLVYERLLSNLTFVKANCPAGSETISTAAAAAG